MVYINEIKNNLTTEEKEKERIKIFKDFNLFSAVGKINYSPNTITTLKNNLAYLKSKKKKEFSLSAIKSPNHIKSFYYAQQNQLSKYEKAKHNQVQINFLNRLIRKLN